MATKKRNPKAKGGLAGIALLLVGAGIIVGGVALSSRFRTPVQSSSSETSQSSSEEAESISVGTGEVVF